MEKLTVKDIIEIVMFAVAVVGFAYVALTCYFNYEDYTNFMDIKNFTEALGLNCTGDYHFNWNLFELI